MGTLGAGKNALHVPAEDFTGLAEEILGRGKQFRFRARGASMSPFITDGDTLVVAPLREDRSVLGQ